MGRTTMNAGSGVGGCFVRNGSPVLWLLALLLVGLIMRPAQAQLFGGGGPGGGGPTLVIENARIITMVGPAIERGTIVMQGGRIIAMGTDVEVPRRAMRVNAEGKTVTPGLIDVSGGLGMDVEGQPGSGALRRAVDGFDPFNELAFDAALRNGVTALYVGPRSGNGFAGTGAVLRLARRDDGGRGVVLEERFDFVIDFTNGDALERVEAFEQARAMFRAALNYRDSIDEYEEKLEEYKEELKKFIEEYEKEQAEGEEEEPAPATQPRGRGGRQGQGGGGNEEEKGPEKPTRPDPSREYDLLLEVLDGELSVRIRADKDADILNALDLAERMGLKFTLEGGAESWLVASQLAEREFTVLLGPTIERVIRFDTNQPRRHSGAYSALRSAGVPVLIGSNGAASGSALATRFVLETAQLALQHEGENPGMRALRMVTVDAARYLGISMQAGTIRRGGVADLVVWSGDPTTGAAAVEQVYINGRPAFTAMRRGGRN